MEATALLGKGLEGAVHIPKDNSDHQSYPVINLARDNNQPGKTQPPVQQGHGCGVTNILLIRVKANSTRCYSYLSLLLGLRTYGL